MKTKIKLVAPAIIGCLLLSPAVAQTNRPASTKPNILFILMDNLGYGEVRS